MISLIIKDITVEGIEPICKALEGDTQVDQLWLKRNPLMPAGAIPLSRLLMNNSYLQVLDLVNTGLLDEVLSNDQLLMNNVLTESRELQLY